MLFRRLYGKRPANDAGRRKMADAEPIAKIISGGG
jgi:hypothetical protein